MKKWLSFFLFILVAQSCIYAQYAIGHRQITWQDPARTNRDVPAEVYYPGTSAGDNVSVASGTFPVIIFGHGFVMGYDAYAFWKDMLVPEGYIMVFPTTEGTSPDHAAFGADLAFLLNTMKAEGTNNASAFYQKIAATSAIAGHSMGGGASFLACANNTVPTCMLTFAAAETTPSAVSAAANIHIPALVFSGEDDCVAPPASNQTPMYNALASSCKAFVSIKSGAHCYFGDYNFLCTLGESTCNPVPAIQRADQLDAAYDFSILFLNCFLKNQPAAWNVFQDSLAASSRVSGMINCSSSGIDESTVVNISVYPNPATDRLIIGSNGKTGYTVRIMTLLGATIYQTDAPSDDFSGLVIDCSAWPCGSYIIQGIGKNSATCQKILLY